MIRDRVRVAALAAIVVLCGGCLSFDEPSVAPTTGVERTAVPSETPRDQRALTVVVPEDPSGFLPPATDDTTRLLLDLLYDPLYRLDSRLVPHPELAADLPTVDASGTGWTVSLRDGLRFQDGSLLAAADVAFTLRLAASPACSLGRDLCDLVTSHLDSATALDRSTLQLTLKAPFSPFLDEVLARLPVLSETAVRAATTRLLNGAANVPPDAPGKQVTDIADRTNADACLSDAPPFGCRLSDYTAALEATLTGAGIGLPPRERFTGSIGEFDAEAYAGALLDRVAGLDLLLTSSATDQFAAALPLLDTKRSLGSGPFRLVEYRPGDAIELRSFADHAGGAPGVPRVRLEIIRDPARAATRLRTGDADWVLRVETDQITGLRDSTGLTVAARPLPAQRTIVFNVRPGRVYADPRTRRAFSLCLDREALAQTATGGSAIVARGPTAAGSWAMSGTAVPKRDPGAAIDLLQAAGWKRGADGIFAQGTKRLTSEVAVRPSRADLVAFAHAAATQLADCGIELLVRELDLTGDLLLSQLQWPNDFDTVLISRSLGDDPDHDVIPFEGAHATSAANPADANPGGYASSEADRYIADARSATDAARRERLYGQLGDLLARDVPAWSIWYDVGWSAISDRVERSSGKVDPAAPGYWWDIATWRLGETPLPPRGTPSARPSAGAP